VAAPIHPDRRPKPPAQRRKLSIALKHYHERCRKALAIAEDLS